MALDSDSSVRLLGGTITGGGTIAATNEHSMFASLILGISVSFLSHVLLTIFQIIVKRFYVPKKPNNRITTETQSNPETEDKGF
jgi:uncharacterized metal-binding protein